MLKICLCSDNHGNYQVIENILNENPACDYYYHLGDSLMSPKDLEPFISVLGNCDYYDFPRQRIVELNNHRILLIHGNPYTTLFNSFIDLAKERQVDTVLFGHTHRFMNEVFDGIRFINPGATTRSRDGDNSYALLYIPDDGEIVVERKII